MASRREYIRVACEAPCILNYKGINYHALLENFSLGGALVKVDNVHPDSLYIGAAVNLTVFNNDLSPMKHSGKVIWLDSSDIGVKF